MSSFVFSSCVLSRFRVAFAILALANSACWFFVEPIYYEDDQRAANELVQKFHSYFNKADYDRMLDLFSERVKSQQSRDQFVQRLREFHQSAGDFKTQSVIKTDIKPQAQTRVVHLIIRSEFEKRRIIEEFDCVVGGYEAVIDFYGHPEKAD